MGHSVLIPQKAGKPIDTSHKTMEELKKAAEHERSRLLAGSPHLRAFQKEIDRRLEKAGGVDDRLAVLGFMMESNLRDIASRFEKLGRLLSQLIPDA